MAPGWYVLRSKPNKEEFFWGQLIAHQVEVYYPCIQAKAANPRAHKDKPYFPGHLFVHVDLQDEISFFLDGMPGSAGLVMFGEQPARVPDGLITTIRLWVDQINATGGEATPGLGLEQMAGLHPDFSDGYAAIAGSGLSGNERVHALLNVLRGRQAPVELSEV
ncbi:MAG: transcription termination/antitermination NusG family protein [Anaerolineales bacterium]